MTRRRRERQRGQGMVEFAIAVIPFLLLLMGIIDLGRAIYQMNGTAQAAREVARVTSVHECANPRLCDLGSSSETAETIAIQRALVPYLAIASATDIVCVGLDDIVVPDNQCSPGHLVRVTARSTFTPATPLVAMFGSRTLESTSRVEIP